MLMSFLDWKYSRLHWSVKKEQILIGGQCDTVTDHGSLLAVNKFYTCTNLVEIF